MINLDNFLTISIFIFLFFSFSFKSLGNKDVKLINFSYSMIFLALAYFLTLSDSLGQYAVISYILSYYNLYLGFCCLANYARFEADNKLIFIVCSFVFLDVCLDLYFINDALRALLVVMLLIRSFIVLFKSKLRDVPHVKMIYFSLFSSLCLLFERVAFVYVSDSSYNLDNHNQAFYLMNVLISISLSVGVLLTVNSLLIKKLHSISLTDELTGCYNRKWLREYLKEKEGCNDKISILIIDIDDFKSINDNLGHGQGDILLKEFSFLLKDNIRSDDYMVRYGGEEFIIILNVNIILSNVIAKKLRLLIEKWRELDKDRRCTASFGVAEWDGHESWSHLFKRADKALYQAKKTGRNKVVSQEGINLDFDTE